jgi:foldase protein PrsA
VKRALALLLVVFSAAAALAGCGTTGDPAAAKVGSETVSRSTLDDELQLMSDNKAFTKALKGQGITMNPSDGGVSTAVSASWLNALVNQSIIDQAFAQRKLKITPQDRSSAQASAPATFFGTAEFAAFPRSFRNMVLAREARTVALKNNLAAAQPPVTPPTDAQLQALFETAKANCPSGKVISHIVVKTKAEADAIEAQLVGGASFPDLAKTKSLDGTSGPGGGLLSCVDSQAYNSLEPALKSTVAATPIGSVAAPVQTQAGFEVIKVQAWNVESARPLLEAAYVQQTAGDPLEKFLNQRLKKSKLWVDPRYGKVSRSAATVTIVPPQAPKPKSKPADTPSSSTGQ